MEKGGWVYILTNRPDGTLYIGVTSELARRVYDHRRNAIDGFTKRYNLHRLVHAEHHETIELAIQRETRMKKWPRTWKVGLIVSHNPQWMDLYDSLS